VKRTLLVTIMLLFAGLIVYAQQASGAAQSAAQIKQNAQQTVTQAKTNSSQFQSTMDNLNAQNAGSIDGVSYDRLKAQIDQLEANIKKEQASMQLLLDQGKKVSSMVVDKIQRLIEQHKAAIADMERFIAK